MITKRSVQLINLLLSLTAIMVLAVLFTPVCFAEHEVTFQCESVYFDAAANLCVSGVLVNHTETNQIIRSATIVVYGENETVMAQSDFSNIGHFVFVKTPLTVTFKFKGISQFDTSQASIGYDLVLN